MHDSSICVAMATFRAAGAGAGMAAAFSVTEGIAKTCKGSTTALRFYVKKLELFCCYGGEGRLCLSDCTAQGP